jgi:tetratricopeptide (TPR) repeat protein
MTLEQGGNVEAARPLFEQSLQLFDELGDSYGVAKLWHCLGRVEHKHRNYDLALDLYRRSLSLYREIRHIANTGALLMDLGKLKMELDSMSEALAFCQEASRVFEGLEDQAGIAAVRTNAGAVHRAQGQLALALKSWSQARALYLEIAPVQAFVVGEAPREGCEASPVGVEKTWVDWLSMYDPVIQMQTMMQLDAAVARLEKALIPEHETKSGETHSGMLPLSG